MKFRGVHRSVRAQRFDRSTGEGPSLGRVARVPGTGMPKEVRRRRKRGERTSDRAGKGGQGRTKVLLIWSLLLMTVALTVLGAFLWFWLRTQMGRQAVAATDGAASQVGQKRNVSAFESPSEHAALELVRNALAARDPAEAARYFRLGSAKPETVAGFLSAMEAVDGPITGFQWLSSMDANDLLIDGVLVSTKKDGVPRNRLALLTPDEKGVWKIDFEAFARTVHPSWEALLAESGGSGRVRVIVARDSYYNGPFRDEFGWVSYGMASPDSDSILLGYCRKDSPQALAMERIVSGEDEDEGRRRLDRATLEIRRPEGAEIRQFEITRVLAEDWILSDVPFDRMGP